MSTRGTHATEFRMMPNNQIWNSFITKVTARDTRRVELKFGIAYSSKFTKAANIPEELLTAHPKTPDDPAPVVRVHEPGDSSVSQIARPWLRAVAYWDVILEINWRDQRRRSRNR